MDKELKNLQPESYYDELYDRGTVEECRRMEKALSKLEYKPNKEKNGKFRKINKKMIIDLSPLPIYFYKGERYLKKAETIKEWMDSDRARDEFFESAVPPKAYCLKCGSELTANFKNFESGYPDKKDRVLFMYDCPNGCLPRRAFYEDGEEWKRRPHLCPKCNIETKEKNSRKGNIITTVYTCLKCGNKEKDVLDLDEKPKFKPEKPDPNFEKDRKRFCMTAQEGQEYIASKASFDNLNRILDDFKNRKETEKKLVGMKKLPVAGLTGLLTPLLEKEGYIKLEFSKPEIGRDVIIQFNVQESKSDREEYDSVHCLQKLIRSVLESTNWRLMSEGIHYKLGILSGRLRGYENDEDLLKLI